MASRNVIIASRVGLHARPAAAFVQQVAAAGIPVTISRAGGTPVNAASMLAVMSLGARCGEEVVLTADGPGAKDVLAGLCTLLETDLDAKVDQ